MATLYQFWDLGQATTTTNAFSGNSNISISTSTGALSVTLPKPSKLVYTGGSIGATNNNVLGDTSTLETFQISSGSGHPSGGTAPGSNDSFEYIGEVSYGTTGMGVAYDTTNHHYYAFIVNGNGTPSSAEPYSGSLDSITNGSTQWNITTGSVGCFCAGMRIATPSGPAAVETLSAGDLVLTADGRAVPVRWVGRSVISAFRGDRTRLLPIRIKAGALDENVPARDLLVSPGHAILVGDVLAHAGALVNGTTIVQDREAPLVFAYYHVALDEHAVLVAEGAPAESYLPGTEEMAFDNMAECPADLQITEMAYPRVKSPRQLPRAVREHLAARAAALLGPVADAA